MEGRRRVLFLGNRSARKVAEQLSEAEHWLRQFGFELLVPEGVGQEGKDIGSLILEHRHEADLVVIGGGDGTLNRAAEALLQTELPLGVLPLGTANDLSHTLDIPTELEDACRTIAAGHVRRVDLGCVNGKHYFNVAGIGLSVRVTRQLDKDLKKRWGVAAYLISAARAVRHLRPFRAKICVGDKSYRVRTIQITVGNGRYYGGHMAVADDATMEDQRLDLYCLEVDRWWQLAPLLLPLVTGRLQGRKHVRVWQGQEFEVITRKPRTVNADGEIVARTPATFRLVPRAIAVFAPPVSSSESTRVVS